MSSASNILAVILVARAMSADAFGRFALGFTVLTAVLTLSRAYFGTRVSLVDNPADGPRMTANLAGALVILAPIITFGVLALSAINTQGASFDILVVIACVTPVVCIQDVVRFGAAASDRPQAALTSDTLWVVIMLVPFAAGIELGPLAAVLLWAGGAVLSMVVALLMIGRAPRLGGGLHELRRRHAVGESLTYASIISALAVVIVIAAASRFVGPAAAGSLRGAATAMGPINVLIAFSALGLTPALVRRARAYDLRFCAITAAALATLTLAWGAVLMLLPTAAGEAFLGDSWHGIRAILPWTIWEYVALTVAAGAVLGLKVRSRPTALVVQRLCAGLVTAVAGTAIALAFRETWPVAAVLVAAGLTSAVVGWSLLARNSPQPQPGYRASDAVGTRGSS